MHCMLYDAGYDEKTRVFTEKQCSDPTCNYCAGRPALHPLNCSECAQYDAFLASVPKLEG
jgi:hypothetical protein